MSGRGAVRRRFRSLLADVWGLGVAPGPIQRLLDSDLGPVRWIPSPGPDRYLADPFGVVRGDRMLVMAEEYDYATRTGRISALEIRPDGSASEPAPAIDLGFHTAYPYLVEHEGELYCIPETSRAGGVWIFKAAGSSTRWTPIACLIEGASLVDPTIVRFAGTWWLFGCDTKAGGSTNLHIWHAPDLFGPWRPHAANPVKTDVRSSRPAGTPFVHEGRLYRPAQDSSMTYGGALVINRVLTLTIDGFEEEGVRRIEPDPTGPYPAGIHTLSVIGDAILVDGKRTELNWVALRGKVRSKLRRGAGSDLGPEASGRLSRPLENQRVAL